MEEVGRGDDQRAEQDQGDDVEHRLRDQGPEQHREASRASGPMRRARTIARAGSPRRAGRVADISTPIIVAEVTSRRRSGLRGQRRAGDRVPGAGAEEHRGHHQRRSRPAPRWRRSARCWSTTWSTPTRLRGDEGEPEAEQRRRRRAPTRRAVRWRSPLRARARGRARAGARAGTRRRAVRRARARSGARRARRSSRGAGTVDARARRRASTSRGDPRPGVALRPTRAPRRPSRASRSRAAAQRLQLLGEPLRVGRRDEDAVDAVADHVGVAGDVRRRAPGSRRRTPRSAPCRSSRRRATGAQSRSASCSRRQSSSSLDPAEGLDSLRSGSGSAT